MLDREVAQCLMSSDATDFIPDESLTEWHPISINRDQRWDAMDMAVTKIREAAKLIDRAHNLSIKVDAE